MTDRLQRLGFLPRRMLLLAILTTLLTGCGQRGGLYLPPQNKSDAPANLPTHAPVNPPADNEK